VHPEGGYPGAQAAIGGDDQNRSAAAGYRLGGGSGLLDDRVVTATGRMDHPQRSGSWAGRHPRARRPFQNENDAGGRWGVRSRPSSRTAARVAPAADGVATTAIATTAIAAAVTVTASTATATTAIAATTAAGHPFEAAARAEAGARRTGFAERRGKARVKPARRAGPVAPPSVRSRSDHVRAVDDPYGAVRGSPGRFARAGAIHRGLVRGAHPRWVMDAHSS
jgi:hypothetical protein